MYICTSLFVSFETPRTTFSNGLLTNNSTIVTLSVVCTLKGLCQHTLFDLGGVEILKYKRSKQCRRCQRYSTDFKALNAMYVEDIKDGVCGFYATLHTEYCYSSHSCQRHRRCQILLYSVYRAPRPARREALCEPSILWV